MNNMKSLIRYIKEDAQKKFTDIIVICNGELLLLRRANYMKTFRGKWCLPGGHIDKGENSETAILRELKEETGIVVDDTPKLWKTWEYSNGDTSDIYQIYFDTKPEVKISREHAQYKWVKIEAKELEKYKEKFAGESYSIIEEILDNLADDKAEY